MDFLYSPGFGGACALLAAVIAFAAAGMSTGQQRRADDAALTESARRRDDLHRAEAIQQCWDRYVSVVDHANEVGIGLTTGLLGRITDTAAELGDRDLVEFLRQFALELLAATAGEPAPPTGPSTVTMEIGKRGESDMTTAELRNSVNSLSAADRATATIQLAKLVAKQSRILGEPIPDLVLQVLNGQNPAFRSTH